MLTCARALLMGLWCLAVAGCFEAADRVPLEAALEGLQLTTGFTPWEILHGVIAFGKDLEIAENFVPLSGPERLAFFHEMLPLVTPQNIPWKAADWDNPVEWKPRNEPPVLP